VTFGVAEQVSAEQLAERSAAPMQVARSEIRCIKNMPIFILGAMGLKE
jgi:hypothetical protein